MRRLSVAFVQLASSSLAGQVIGFVVLAVVARRVGPANLGAYGFATNLLALFLFPLYGLAMLGTRDIAQNPARAGGVTADVLPLLAGYAACVCSAAYVLAPRVAPTMAAATMLRIVAVTVTVSALTLTWVLQGLQAFKTMAALNLLGQVVFGVAAFLWTSDGLEGAYRYAWFNALGLCAALVATWVVVVRRVGWPAIRWAPRSSLAVVRRSAPFAVSFVMIQLYYSADFVLLGYLTTSAAVGQYLVAYKLPLVLLGYASLWITVFYPHAATQEPAALTRQIGLFTTFTLVLVAPLCAGSFVLGEPLVTLLFGAGYGPAGSYFELLMIAVAFAAVDANIGQVLLATGHERAFAYGVGLGAFVNLTLNLLLIPWLGPQGAAIATIVAEAVVLAFMITRLRIAVGTPRLLWGRVAAGVTSAGLMMLALDLAFSGWPVIPRLVWGIVVFVVAAVVTRAVRPSDYRLLRGAPP